MTYMLNSIGRLNRTPYIPYGFFLFFLYIKCRLRATALPHISILAKEIIQSDNFILDAHLFNKFDYTRNGNVTFSVVHNSKKRCLM